MDLRLPTLWSSWVVLRATEAAFPVSGRTQNREAKLSGTGASREGPRGREQGLTEADQGLLQEQGAVTLSGGRQGSGEGIRQT